MNRLLWTFPALAILSGCGYLPVWSPEEGFIKAAPLRLL